MTPKEIEVAHDLYNKVFENKTNLTPSLVLSDKDKILFFAVLLVDTLRARPDNRRTIDIFHTVQGRIAKNVSYREASEITGLSGSRICCLLKSKSKSKRGYSFTYGFLKV